MITAPAVSNIPSVVSDDNVPIKRGRIKNVGDLVGAHDTLWRDDLNSAYNRMLAQQARDGAPPYSIVKEKALGLSGRSNVNFGMVDQIASDAEAPYSDLLEGIDEFCTLPTGYGDENSRLYWQPVMAEEFTRMLRSWPRFYPLWMQNVRMFVDEGVSFAFFDDDLDWRWSIKGLQDLKFPRRTIADINELDIVTSKVMMMPHKLFQYCQDDIAAEEEGWNKKAVWEAIKQCTAQHTIAANDVQEWETAWKNNDLILGDTNYTVETIHGWVRELDGTVSHYIARADGVGDFLYKSEGKYRNMSSMLVPFLYGVGANGTFHSIRGVLNKVFAACAGMNRVFNRMLDMSIHASTPFISTETEDTITELPLISMGQYVVLKPGAKFAEQKIPDFAQALIPAMNYLEQFVGQRGATFTGNNPASIAGPNAAKTKYGQQAADEAAGRLSTSGMNMFKAGWTMLIKEIARRVKRNPYGANEPGGVEVQDFVKRCLDRGVPRKAIDEIDIDRIEVNLGLGRGSAAERRVVVDQLNANIYQRLDPEGQNKLNNLTVAAYAGTRIANLLVPPVEGQRPPIDLQIANLENFPLEQGQEIPVEPNQNHAVHIGDSHLPAMAKVNDGLTQEQVSLDQAIPQLQSLMAHCNAHMQMMDPTDPKLPMFKDALNQFNQVVTNGLKQLYAQQEKMQREMAHNHKIGAGGSEPSGDATTPQNGQESPEMASGGNRGTMANASTLVQAAQAAQKVADMKLMTQQKMAMRAAEFSQKMALKDAEMAAKVRRGI